MQRLVFFIACSLCLIRPSFAQLPAKQWDRTLGGSGEERLTGLQPTRDGGSILVGASQSGRSGDKSHASQGEEDVWVVKLDAQGQKQWDRTLGGSDYDGATCVQQTADGGYIVGAYSNSPSSGDKTQASQGRVDYWILKLDAQGQKQWDRTLGGDADDTPVSVQQTTDGGYVLAGTSSSAASSDKSHGSRGKSDYWVVKLDSEGRKQWDRTLGGSSLDACTSLQQSPDGGYLLGGYSQSAASGEKTQASQGSYDYWLVKLDGQGQPQWDRTLGGSESDYLQALHATADGGALLAGESYSGVSGDKSQPTLGRRDYWLVNVDAQGQKQWDRAYGTAQEDYLAGLTPTADGGWLFGGNDHTTYWVMQLDAQGARQWERTLTAGSAYTTLTQVRTAADGGYLLGGMSTSDVAGDKSEPSQGGELYGDYWVVKLAPAVLATRPKTSGATLAVYPNPAHGRVQVQLPPALATHTVQVSVRNALGQTVLEQTLAPQAGTELSLASWPAGVYTVQVRAAQGVWSQRLIVE